MYFCRVGESLQLFFWFPNSLFFPLLWSISTFPLLRSPHTMVMKVKLHLGFVFFSFSFSLVPASLSSAFAPSAWNSSGHGEAAGLSFVSRNHSYWFGVWGSYGGSALCRREAACSGVLLGVWLPEPTCFWGFVLFAHRTDSFHCWVKLFSQQWFTENVVFFWSAGGGRILLQPGNLKESNNLHSLSTCSCFERGILPDLNYSEWWYLSSAFRMLRL